mmetsp:Transcript_25426/g.64176  ORF Transcript_25426/g.64176 Transcript_25426/m.64176 type:complete len:223 (-) Transcript_25426:6-674(-)
MSLSTCAASEVSSFPSLQTVCSPRRWILPLISCVGMPNCRRWASIECGSLAKVSSPFGSTTVSVAVAPARAKSWGRYSAKRLCTSDGDLSEKSKAQGPVILLAIWCTPSWHSVEGVVPSANCMTLFFAQINLDGRNFCLTVCMKVFRSFSMETKYKRENFSHDVRISSMSVSFFSFGCFFVFVKVITLLRFDLGILRSWLEDGTGNCTRRVNASRQNELGPQ